MYINRMQRADLARANTVLSSDMDGPVGPPSGLDGLRARGVDHPVDQIVGAAAPSSYSPATDLYTEVEMIGVSFGAAQCYAADGGYPVMSDQCLLSSPVDLAALGVGLHPAQQGELLTAAYHLGETRAVHLLVRLIRRTPGLIYLRARSSKQIRVPQARVVFNEEGAASAVLPVTGLPLDQVGTTHELWTWEWREEGSENFRPIPFKSGDPIHEGLPVRVYVTAGRPMNPCPRESFYYIACAAGGAVDAAQAEQGVWNYFTQFREEIPVTNARHEPLNSWGDCAPGSADSVDFRDRDAKALVNLGDAGCQAWGDLLCQAMAIHGIAAEMKTVAPHPDLLARERRLPDLNQTDSKGNKSPFIALGMMVKSFHWARTPGLDKPMVSDNQIIDCGDFKWRLNLPTEITCASWSQTDVKDLGRPLNCRRNLAGHTYGLFANHLVVRVYSDGKERWYDPTYGLGPHVSLAGYEHELLGKGDRDSGGLYAIIGCQVSRASYPVQDNNPSTTKYLLGAMPAPLAPVLKAID